MNRHLKRHVELNGGYVHPDLVLLEGKEAAHGEVSLFGVSSSERSLMIPYRLFETRDNQGVWCAFLHLKGYDTFGDAFWAHHSFAYGVAPILGAANHNDRGGYIVETTKGVELYGIDFRYAAGKAQLNNLGVNNEHP